MGNGKGVVVDIETSPDTVTVNGTTLTLQDIENMATVSMNNMGMPNYIFMAPGTLRVMNGLSWQMNPEFDPLPWAELSRITKREYRVAALHTFLFKMKVLKKLTDEDHEAFKNKAVKRLKKAKWAKYQQRKKIRS